MNVHLFKMSIIWCVKVHATYMITGKKEGKKKHKLKDTITSCKCSIWDKQTELPLASHSVELRFMAIYTVYKLWRDGDHDLLHKK